MLITEFINFGIEVLRAPSRNWTGNLPICMQCPNPQASNHCKKVFEAAKFTYAHKTKEFITSQKLGPQDFWPIGNSVLNKGKSAVLLYLIARRCCLLQLIKQNCLLKTFLKTLILMTQVFLYLFSLLEVIWNGIIFLLLPRWLKRS